MEGRTDLGWVSECKSLPKLLRFLYAKGFTAPPPARHKASDCALVTVRLLFTAPTSPSPPHSPRMQDVDVAKYCVIYETWDLAQPGSRAALPQEDTVMISAAPALRQLVQTARIAQRMSIGSLALSIQCDASTLAAFERGDEVLHASLQARLRRVLGISAQ